MKTATNDQLKKKTYGINSNLTYLPYSVRRKNYSTITKSINSLLNKSNKVFTFWAAIEKISTLFKIITEFPSTPCSFTVHI
jgi:hypothetical protein